MTTRRAAILLELLLAVAVFLAAAITILTLIARASDSVRAARDQHIAADYARSAMAQIEAGIARPETLAGPIPTTSEEDEAGFADAPQPPSLWTLDIQTEPARYPPLTAVTVTARKLRAPGREDAVLAMFTLTQFVRLGTPQNDAAGQEDPLAEQAKRALDRPRDQGGTP